MNTFFRFCLVGAAGFCIDGGLLQAGIHLLGLGVIAARVPSFTAAVLATWWMNRTFTFRAAGKSFRNSFPPYVAANAVGLALNFGIYSAGVLFSETLAAMPLAALGIGAVLGLAFNYAASRLWVFGKD